MKLLILDRDGVINHDSDAYIKSVEEWIPLPGSIEAIAQLSRAGWTVAVATNQSGIARGYYDLATTSACARWWRNRVANSAWWCIAPMDRTKAAIAANPSPACSGPLLRITLSSCLGYGLSATA